MPDRKKKKKKKKEKEIPSVCFDFWAVSHILRSVDYSFKGRLVMINTESMMFGLGKLEKRKEKNQSEKPV